MSDGGLPLFIVIVGIAILGIAGEPKLITTTTTTLHTNAPAARAAVRKCLHSVSIDAKEIVSVNIAPVGNGAYSVKCKRKVRRDNEQ